MKKREAMQPQALTEKPRRPASRLKTARQAGADSLCLTVSVEDAARMLGISRGAAYTHARDGSLPTIKLGKRLLVPKAALEKMLSAGAS
jgi:excisionase family DNA binding protein